MNTREATRRTRIAHIKEWIYKAKESNNELSRDKLMATIMIEFGVEKRKAMDYLTPFIIMGEI